jgi:hypothetical protein
MDDRDPRTTRDPAHDDHWDVFAEAMDLTIEGHRLIAEEIVYEAKLLWRNAMAWLPDIGGMMAKRRPTPPA